MNAPPLTGPAALVEAVPYLLVFTPTGGLVIVGLAAITVAVIARVDLDRLRPEQHAELAHTLRDKAGATAMIALTYGHTANPSPSPPPPAPWAYSLAITCGSPRAGTGR